MKKASKTTKTTEATRKAARKPAKSVRKPGKANTPAKVAKPATAKKSATPAKPAKVEAVKVAEKTAKPPKPAPVELPAVFRCANGDKLTVTAKSITLEHGLMEVTFDPRHVYQYPADVTERDGEKLSEPIKAGWCSVRRGSVCVGFKTPEIIAAVLTAKEAAKAEKAEKKGGAK